MVGEWVQGADGSEGAPLVGIEMGAAQEIAERGERVFAASGEHGVGRGGAQPLDVEKADAKGVIGLDGAVPIGSEDADRLGLETVAAGVLQ